MAPCLASCRDPAGREAKDGGEARGSRKARKPLVEKQRRARINESLQELRVLLAGAEVQAKLENAEVLELTVRRVQGALRGRARGREQLQAEASERFAAGYIQCMHEVHTFVSTCQAIDATVAAELLNHLLESMPLREGGSLPDLLGDALAGPGGSQRSRRSVGGTSGSPLPCRSGPGDDLCSDPEEAPDAELSRAPTEGPDLVSQALGSLTAASLVHSIWRPW